MANSTIDLDELVTLMNVHDDNETVPDSADSDSDGDSDINLSDISSEVESEDENNGNNNDVDPYLSEYVPIWTEGDF